MTDSPLPSPSPAPTVTATPANWVGAIAAALALQIAAAMAMAAAVAIVIVAAFSTWGDRSPETPAFVVFAPLAAIVGVGLYVLSGRVAARIAQDRRGWWMLAVGPLILVALRIAAVLLVS